MQMHYHGDLVNLLTSSREKYRREPECATTIEQVRVSTRSKQSHSVEPNLMNSEILKNWEPEEIRESQLNDKQIEMPIQLYNR